MDLSVTFIGTAASVPTAARGVSATLIARGGERILIDCGEGTQRQLMRSGWGLVDLDVVALTHLHADHYLGLPGLLKSYGLRDRERALALVGPPGLRALLQALGPVIGRVRFPLEVRELTPGSTVALAGARVEAVPTRHSVPSLAYALVEDARPGAFDVAAARALGVPAGPLFGALQRGEELVLDDGARVCPEQVLGPARAGRRVVVSGDTEPCESVLEAARGASLLAHEATFLHEDRERARATRHTTAREAGALARQAGVALLALVHLSGRVWPREARAEAEAEGPERVIVPRDFDRVELPFPERGGPVHVAAPRTERPSRPEGGAPASDASEPPATVTGSD